MRVTVRAAAWLIVAALLGGAAPGEDAALRRAQRRGLALAQYDRAAWVGTDDLMARLPVERRPEVGGWVVTPRSDGLHVDFFGKGATADRAVYAADFDGKAIVRSTVYPANGMPPLTDLAMRQKHALDLARAELARHGDWRPCTAAPFNTVVLPPEADGAVPVYFLTPQTETGSFPFGGHYEIDVAADGHIVATRPFTRSCLALKKKTFPPGATPAALFVTHLLDSQPTEIHVFEQAQVGLPVYVGTGPSSIWKVDGGRIARCEMNKGTPTCGS